MSKMLNGLISHDQITRQLGEGKYDSQYLWQQVKPMVREICTQDEWVVVCVDDTIEEKPYTDESELICWHFDHTINRAVKGVNFLTASINTHGTTLPCAVEFVRKDVWQQDKKTGKLKRKSSKTKNKLYCQMLAVCQQNFPFDYVVNDSWYSSHENMLFVKEQLGRHFVMALKSNRKAALRRKDKEEGHSQGIESLQPGQQPMEIWLEGLNFPLLLVKQVFKNEDGTEGVLYLACSDVSLGYEQITAIYKRRWSAEVYHKSLKSNAGFAKSPTKTITTQTSHFILSILAYVKLEWLRMRNNLNHFALKALIYQAALKAAYKELKNLSTPATQKIAF
ncbi:MAG: transposase [Bacteroidota bacterium]|nr:transposase [Bacteroidota bacterium]